MDIKVTPEYFKKILLHEYFMSAFILQMLIRLACNICFNSWSVIYISTLTAYWALIYMSIKTQNYYLNKIRLLINFIVMCIVYTSVKYVMPFLFNGMTYDDSLCEIDKLIFGVYPSVWMQNIYSNLLTEVLSLCYLSYSIVLFICLIGYGLRSHINKLCFFTMGIYSIYGIGFIGYSIIPACGPYVYLVDKYVKEITGYFFTHFNAITVASGSAKFDVFPSLHVGISLFMLMFFFAHNRKFFYAYLVPFMGIVTSTIYLRYHYFIDLVVGAILTIVVYFLCKFVFRKITNNNKFLTKILG